jgi:hypothetical protein
MIAMNISEGNIDDGYRPKLFINLKTVSDKKLQDEFYKEIKAGSITPRTFKSRAFDTKDSEWFIDTYSPKNNPDTKVHRYGINYSKIGVKIKEVIFGTQKGEILDQEYDLLYLGGKQASSLSTSIVSKDSSSGKNENTSNKIKYLELEMDLIIKAVDYLLGNPKKSAVGIDIIARHKGAIKVLKGANESYYPETHSVVLYKNPANKTTKKHEILVIDPSNFKY